MTYAISDRGLALIRAHEGFRAQPAPLPGGDWVVGHGHVRAGDAGAALTQSEAAELLARDLAPFERLVNERVAWSIGQSQFDALVSFAFSIGAAAFEKSQVLRLVNAGELVAAACAMDAWRKSEVTGELEVSAALVRRRAAEKLTLLRGLPLGAATTPVLQAKLDHAASILGAPARRPAAPSAAASGAARKPDLGKRLTEILRSEPTTNMLLLAKAAPAEACEDEDEITTAHARPVARPLDRAREAARRAHEASLKRRKPRLFDWERRLDSETFVSVGRRLREMRAKRLTVPAHWPSPQFGWRRGQSADAADV
jgi:lysozyme